MVAQEEAGQHQMEDVTAAHDSYKSLTNINPFRKAFVETESPDSDPIFRLETDEEQFRRHMEWFREVEGMGSLPDDDGEEGERPPNGYIHFDKQGKLWYRQHGRSKWERAVFHYWIRHELSVLYKEVPYVFSRKHGLMVGDETCPCTNQHTWGTARKDYPNVMFQYSPPTERPPTERVSHLTFCGLVVIDFRLYPVRKFYDIPLVLSSEYEGDFMEPARRCNSQLIYEDFRARMPPIIQVQDKVWKPLHKAELLVGRTRCFREKSGNIAWDPTEEEDSEELREYMDARLSRLLGGDRNPDSIKSLPNLSRLELFDLRVFGSVVASKMAKATAGPPIDTPMTDATNDIDEPSTKPEPLAFPFCPSGRSLDSRVGGPTPVELGLALFARLDSTAKRNGQLMAYEPTDFSGSHTCWFSRWIMVQRELCANWRESDPPPQLWSILRE